jgi:hypothetical protein
MHFGVVLIDTREQVFQFDLEHASEVKKLKITDPNKSRLDFGDGATSYVPASELQLHRKHILGPAELVSQLTDLRPYYVSVPHCSCFGTEAIEAWDQLTCSGLGAIIRK